MSSCYIGRFAPSPSGPLHFGSLVAALGSYLRAKSQTGKWLVRVEDIDPPREVEGAATDILRTLEIFGLEWDEPVLFQSQRTSVYDFTLEQLIENQQAYYCQCTRKQIQAMGGSYNGRCRHKVPPWQQGAIRVKNSVAIDHFDDPIIGEITAEKDFAAEDFIVKRRDGLFAYQLAVVLDDAYQGITEVVRGRDLLLPTVRQLTLFNQLGLIAPNYLHLPLACEADGRKLSKQNHATAIDIKQPQLILNSLLHFLGQPSVDTAGDIRIMLAQAVAQFELKTIPTKNSLINPPHCQGRN